MSAAREVKTAGIASAVFGEDRAVLGHVLMADYDDVDESAAVDHATRVDGPAVVVRSSPGSHHVYGLGVRPWGDLIDELRGTGASQGFVEEMLDRERAVLRIAAKLDVETDEVVTDAPVPFLVLDDEGDAPVSRPHAIRLSQLAEDAGEHRAARQLDRLATGPRAFGETLTREMWAYAVEGR